MMSSMKDCAVPSSPASGVDHDVIVMGGGLAGLTLAMQLRDRCPGIDVRVLERRAHPVPAASHKVGESTVEIGAHYFAEVLGLREHLEAAQLRKFGFRFFFSDGRRDLDGVTELGASRPLAVTSYQLDRGLFENFLAAEAQRRGVRFDDATTIRRAELGDEGQPHAVSWQRAGEPLQRATCRWLIDASGRVGLLKRQLGLGLDNDHKVHAVWFRIGDRLRLDDWAHDPAWQRRCETPTRWLSTNHLVGAGYWVWLIPLASGSHSVGIVADPAYHPFERMDTFEHAMDWLAERQPCLYEALDRRRDRLQDFAFLRNLSYDCRQVLSDQRWALAGEAGRFLDPFYSPGSDFIGMGNTLITELIARDRAGQPLSAHAQIYEQILRSFYDSTLTLYRGQYGLFGDPQVLPQKVLWDYSYYWGVAAQLFFHGRLANLAVLARLRSELAQCQRLNAAVQALLHDWSAYNAAEGEPRANPPVMLDQAALPWFAELNRSLTDTLDDAAFCSRIQDGARLLARLAAQLRQAAVEAVPGLDTAAMDTCLAGVTAPAGHAAGDARLLFA